MVLLVVRVLFMLSMFAMVIVVAMMHPLLGPAHPRRECEEHQDRTDRQHDRAAAGTVVSMTVIGRFGVAGNRFILHRLVSQRPARIEAYLLNSNGKR